MFNTTQPLQYEGRVDRVNWRFAKRNMKRIARRANAPINIKKLKKVLTDNIDTPSNDPTCATIRTIRNWL